MASGTPWPHLLADLTAKRDALTGLIDTIRLHFHNDADPSTMPESPIVRPRGSTPPKRSTKKATAGKRDGTGREQTSRQRAPRSLPDVTAKGEAILAALRAHSPQSPSELAKRLKISRPLLTYRLKPLLKSGAVRATGATMNRKFSLPGRTNGPKEEP